MLIMQIQKKYSAWHVGLEEYFCVLMEFILGLLTKVYVISRHCNGFDIFTFFSTPITQYSNKFNCLRGGNALCLHPDAHNNRNILKYVLKSMIFFFLRIFGIDFQFWGISIKPDDE